MSGARATVFGMDVWADFPLSLFHGTSAHATGRTLAVFAKPGAAAALGACKEFEPICDQLEPDGTLSFCIEAHADAGYLLHGPAYGAHLLAADGRRLHSVPGDAAETAWQRFLIAQVLPFAAALNGLEVLHASAVVMDGRAVAFAGPSRAGKTSLALELCGLGACFLADDVLALEGDGSALVGHPGTAVAGLDHGEAQRVRDSLASAEILGVNDREMLVRTVPVDAPAPLAAVFFLDRRPDGPAQPRFEPVTDARVLLGATFNFLLSTPQRLRRLLEVCATVAERRVERVLAGPSVNAAHLATAVAQRVMQSP